jgi:hypothetical protein
MSRNAIGSAAWANVVPIRIVTAEIIEKRVMIPPSGFEGI